MPAEQHDATTEFNEALKAAFNEGRYDELAGFFTADCVLLPPRGRMLDGRGAVATFWRSVKTRFDGLVFTTTGLKDLGEATKREIGTYAPAAADGTASTPEGKYVFVWQLVDGEWQIESAIWNRSTAPGQGQGEGRQGQGGVQGGGQRRGGGQGGGPGGGQRRPGAPGQGGGYRQGGGYGRGGQGAGGPGQGGYRQGNRPSFQGGGGIGGGGGRRGGGGQRRGGPQGGGQGGGGNLYEQSGGLYSDLKD